MLAEPSIEKKLKRLSESPEMAGECIASLLQTLNVHNPVATLRRITQYPTLQEKKKLLLRSVNWKSTRLFNHAIYSDLPLTQLLLETGWALKKDTLYAVVLCEVWDAPLRSAGLKKFLRRFDSTR